MNTSIRLLAISGSSDSFSQEEHETCCELDLALAQIINFICGASIVLQAMEFGIYVMQALADCSGIGGGFPSRAAQRVSIVQPWAIKCTNIGSFERELKLS